MAAESSSNDSLPHPSPYSVDIFKMCLATAPSTYIFIAFNAANILLLLPLCILSLHHGVQQWRRNMKASHSDHITYHVVSMDLIRVLGCVLSCCSVSRSRPDLNSLGFNLFNFTWFAELFFHVLTCVERYLAVVHPVTYRGLRTDRGPRIRNATIGCVWLLSFAGVGLFLLQRNLIIINFCYFTLCVAVVAFCSVSVLQALVRPGPGEQGGNKERVDQSKKRAFYTIMAILGVIMFRFILSSVWVVVFLSEKGGACVVLMTVLVLSVPTSVVAPLLFVCRKGKLKYRRKRPL